MVVSNKSFNADEIHIMDFPMKLLELNRGIKYNGITYNANTIWIYKLLLVWLVCILRWYIATLAALFIFGERSMSTIAAHS